MYQVSYDGKNWESVEENRVLHVLAGFYKEVPLVLQEMGQGREVRTAGAVYRINPATRPASGEQGGRVKGTSKMGMPRGLAKATAYYNKIEAWRDWEAPCEQAKAEGYDHLIEQFAPPESAGWRKVDQAIGKLREAMQKAKDEALPHDHSRGRSKLFKTD